jgi:hypothetical protein
MLEVAEPEADVDAGADVGVAAEALAHPPRIAARITNAAAADAGDRSWATDLLIVSASSRGAHLGPTPDPPDWSVRVDAREMPAVPAHVVAFAEHLEAVARCAP